MKSSRAKDGLIAIKIQFGKHNPNLLVNIEIGSDLLKGSGRSKNLLTKMRLLNLNLTLKNCYTVHSQILNILHFKTEVTTNCHLNKQRYFVYFQHIF